jgi:parallel beta-helix repeat protein
MDQQKFIATTIIFCVFVLLFNESTWAQTTLCYVDDDYSRETLGFGIDHFTTVQEAITACMKGGIVIIHNGTYCESVIVNKSLQLHGKIYEQVNIIGKNNKSTLAIYSDNVTIENITLSHTTISDCSYGVHVSSNNNSIKQVSVKNNSIGIFLQNCSSNTLVNNLIHNNTYGVGIEYGSQHFISKNYAYKNNITGIYLSSSSNNTLTLNHIYKGSYGIALSFCSNNILERNTLEKNREDGFNFYFCNTTFLRTNHILDNSCGISLSLSDANFISANHLINNKKYGIKLLLSSNNNKVNDNTIVNSSIGVYISNGSSGNKIISNLFSSTTQKIIDVSITNDKFHIPGFQPFLVIVLILLCYKKYVSKNKIKYKK